MPEDKFLSKKESPFFKTMPSSFSILTMILKKASNSLDEDFIFAAWRASFNLLGIKMIQIFLSIYLCMLNYNTDNVIIF